MKKEQKTKERNLRGFTLIEMLISVFIFLLIMTATVTIFTREITASRVARETQKSLENAQFTLNYLSKVLRTSEIDDVDSDQELYAYDNSQEKCFYFFFSDSSLMMRKQTDGEEMKADSCDRIDLDLSQMDPETTLTIGRVTGKFEGQKTRGKVPDGNVTSKDDVMVGAVTTSLVIEPKHQTKSGTSEEKTYIQSTVSLRDYPSAGIPL